MKANLAGVWIQRHVEEPESVPALLKEMMAEYVASGGTDPVRCWVDNERRLLLVGPDIGDVPWPIRVPEEHG